MIMILFVVCAYNEAKFGNFFYHLWLKVIESKKMTVSVILSDPPCKNGNARFITVPFKVFFLIIFVLIL